MKMSITSGGLAGLVLCALSATVPVATSAQQAQIYYVNSHAAPAAFQGAGGFGGAMTLQVRDWLGLRASVDRRAHSSTEVGLSCVNLTLNINCEEDRLHLDSRMTAVTISGVPSWSPTPRIELGTGAGMVISQVGTDVTNESGLIPNVFTKSTGNLGFLALALARITPMAASPLFLSVEFQGRYIDLEGCPEEQGALTPLAPFCGAEWWTELHVGAGIRF